MGQNRKGRIKRFEEIHIRYPMGYYSITSVSIYFSSKFM